MYFSALKSSIFFLKCVWCYVALSKEDVISVLEQKLMHSLAGLPLVRFWNCLPNKKFCIHFCDFSECFCKISSIFIFQSSFSYFSTFPLLICPSLIFSETTYGQIWPFEHFMDLATLPSIKKAGNGWRVCGDGGNDRVLT